MPKSNSNSKTLRRSKRLMEKKQRQNSINAERDANAEGRTQRRTQRRVERRTERNAMNAERREIDRALRALTEERRAQSNQNARRSGRNHGHV